MAELAYAHDSKSCGLTTVWVQIPPAAQMTKNKQYKIDKEILSYIVGAAIGDGNLSNPNGRAVRLRITCDTNYPNIIDGLIACIKEILPENKVKYRKLQRNIHKY